MSPLSAGRWAHLVTHARPVRLLYTEQYAGKVIQMSRWQIKQAAVDAWIKDELEDPTKEEIQY